MSVQQTKSSPPSQIQHVGSEPSPVSANCRVLFNARCQGEINSCPNDHPATAPVGNRSHQTALPGKTAPSASAIPVPRDTSKNLLFALTTKFAKYSTAGPEPSPLATARANTGVGISDQNVRALTLSDLCPNLPASFLITGIEIGGVYLSYEKQLESEPFGNAIASTLSGHSP